MADYSNARIYMSLFQQLEKDRQSDRSCHATGSLEISVDDLNEFFSLAMALKPEDNWNGTKKVIKLRCGVWHRVTKNGKPWESITVSPERAAVFKEEDISAPYTSDKPPLVTATVVADDEEI